MVSNGITAAALLRVQLSMALSLGEAPPTLSWRWQHATDALRHVMCVIVAWRLQVRGFPCGFPPRMSSPGRPGLSTPSASLMGALHREAEAKSENPSCPALVQTPR